MYKHSFTFKVFFLAKDNNSCKRTSRVTKLKLDLYNTKTKRKREQTWLSPTTKVPTPTEKSKKERDNTQTPPKTSITQGLRTNLGR